MFDNIIFYLLSIKPTFQRLKYVHEILIFELSQISSENLILKFWVLKILILFFFKTAFSLFCIYAGRRIKDVYLQFES